MKIIKEILFWTWCLPQTLVGLVVKLIFKGKKVKVWTKGAQSKLKTYYYYDYSCERGSISLGKYILICPGHKDDRETIKHEVGHQIQSFILGPLYLLIIGLPSLLWCWFGQNLINKIRLKKGKERLSYSWFYTESWANKLVGIK